MSKPKVRPKKGSIRRRMVDTMAVPFGYVSFFLPKDRPAEDVDAAREIEADYQAEDEELHKAEKPKKTKKAS